MLLKSSSAAMLGAFGGMIALVATCTQCGTGSQSAPDDASPVDAGRDARRPRDAQTAVELDADTRDADTFDRSWLQGAWDPPPGTWPRCHLLIAQNPERDVKPLQWKACASGRTGCRTSVSDWDPSTTHETLLTGGEAVHIDANGKPYLMYLRTYPSTFQSGTNHTMDVVQQIDGPAVAASAMTSPATSECGGYLHLYRGGGFLYHLLSEIPTEPWNLLWTSFAAPRQPMSSVFVRRSQTGDGGAGIGAGNDGTVLVHNADVGQWFIVNRLTSSVIQPTEASAVVPLDQARSLPDGYLARKLGGNFPIMRVWNDGHMVPLLSTMDASRFVIGYETDIVDSTLLVWVEATSLFAPRTMPVLYTATRTDSAATLVPRRVTTYPDPGGLGGGYFIVANGMALLRTSATTAELVRISDGQHWSISAEPGMGFRDPLWVSADEVWIHMANYYPGNGVVANNDAILRLRIDSLGAGAPAQ